MLQIITLLLLLFQKVVWSSGKILGGSSAVNSMNMMRGSKFDYDLWQDLGNEGWSYNDVLPIFEEIETGETHFFCKY